jgi:hypothetical protein
MSLIAYRVSRIAYTCTYLRRTYGAPQVQMCARAQAPKESHIAEIISDHWRQL